MTPLALSSRPVVSMGNPKTWLKISSSRLIPAPNLSAGAHNPPMERAPTSMTQGGEWVYLYRVVDREGMTVDFRLSTRRDVAAARTFFRQAMKGQGSPPTDRHIGRLCGIAPRRARDES